jgi:hypothetical protein
MTFVKTFILSFIAGFLATLIFHQGARFVLYQIHLIPPERPPWPLDPVPPFGVPSVISKAFWGGVWGAALAPLLDRFRGATYWMSRILVGGILLSLTGIYLVTSMKGQPIPPLWPRFLSAFIANGAWGLGMALFLRLSAKCGRAQPEPRGGQRPRRGTPSPLCRCRAPHFRVVPRCRRRDLPLRHREGRQWRGRYLQAA